MNKDSDKDNLDVPYIGLAEALAASIPLPIDIVDEKGHILYANEVMKNACKGGIVGKKCWEVYKDNAEECAQCPLHEKIEIGKTKKTESAGVLGGKIFQISHTGIVFDGKPAMLEVFYDVTDHKQLIEMEKQNLRQQVSVNQLAHILLLDLPLNDLLDKGLEHVCNDVIIDLKNSGGIYLLNKKTDELVLTINHNLSQCVAQECAKVSVGKKFCGETAKQKVMRFASRFDEASEKCSSGLPYGHYSVPIVYGEELLGVMVLYLENRHDRRGIEERYLKTISGLMANLIKNKEAEKTINKLSQVVEQSSNAVVITDVNGNIEYVNSKFTEITGYADHEVVGKNPKILRSGNTSKEAYKDLWNTILSGDTWRGEFQNRKKDGELYWQSATISGIKNKEGEITHFAAVNEDVTDQKLIQAALADANRELVGKERETLSMLDDIQKAHEELKSAQSQLVQSEKLASLGHLSAGVAHEINNPLAFISSNMEILRDYFNKFTEMFNIYGLLKKAAKENNMDHAGRVIEKINQLELKHNISFMLQDAGACLDETRGGLERIRKIVSDLRIFTRKEEEKFELASIEDVLDGMINIVWNELKYKVDLHKEYNSGQMVMCNAQKLGQVFINLLMNASQAMEEKGEIRVKTYQKGKFVFIEISDTGCGIPADKVTQIFDPFFTTKKVGEGTGLGLSVSYDIVKQHKGEITVESEVGKGTTFIIQLPAEQGDSNGKEN